MRSRKKRDLNGFELSHLQDHLPILGLGLSSAEISLVLYFTEYIIFQNQSKVLRTPYICLNQTFDKPQMIK